MEPEGARALASQIHACLAARDWPSARESLARYCEAWPNHRKAWYLRAFVEWSLGDVRKAEESVEKALEISPTYSRALQLRERLVAREDSFLSDNVDLATGRFLGPPDVVLPSGAEGSSAWAPAGEEDAEASRAAQGTVRVPAVQARRADRRALQAPEPARIGRDGACNGRGSIPNCTTGWSPSSAFTASCLPPLRAWNGLNAKCRPSQD